MNYIAESESLPMFWIVFLIITGGIALFYLIIIIEVAIIRWIFRINTIVTLLKDILSAIRPQNLISTDLPSLQLCDGCRRNFDKSQLKKIDSGQMLCPECILVLKKKKAKGG